jgi:hypothetical protein
VGAGAGDDPVGDGELGELAAAAGGGLGGGVVPVGDRLHTRPVVRTFVRVGLTWDEALPGRLWRGAGADGLHRAQVVASTDGGHRVFVSARGCGHPDGLWLDGRWAEAEEAQDAADRHVVAFVDWPHVEPREPP